MLPAYWSLTMLWNKSISLPIVFIRIHSSLYKKLIKSTSEEEIMSNIPIKSKLPK